MAFDVLTTTVAAILTIGCLSFLYKDNIFFRTLNNTAIGLGAGVTCANAVRILANQAWPGLASGEPYAYIGLVFGLLLFTKFLKQYQWLSRWTGALILGVGTGVTLGAYVQSQIIAQISSTAALKFIGVDASTVFNSIIVLVLSVSALAYFLFTWEQKGVLRVPAKIGRYALMIAFGTAYGNTVTSRYSSAIGRVAFVILDWLLPLLGLA